MEKDKLKMIVKILEGDDKLKEQLYNGYFRSDRDRDIMNATEAYKENVVKYDANLLNNKIDELNNFVNKRFKSLKINLFLFFNICFSLYIKLQKY